MPTDVTTPRSFEAARRIGASATRAWIGALLILAVIAGAKYIVTYVALREAADVPYYMTVAADQRIRVTQIGEGMARLTQFSTRSADRTALIAGIRGNMVDLMAAHITLLSTVELSNDDNADNSALRLLYFERGQGLDFRLRRFARLIDLTLDVEPRLLNPDHVGQILLLAREGLPELMDQALALRRDAAEDAMSRLNILLFLLFLSLLGTLALIGLLIFRPMVRTAMKRALRLVELQEALSHSDSHDRLTGLVNRMGAQQLFIATVQPKRGNGVAVLHLDIRHFRQVNESLGHEAGDLVLREAAERIKQVVRGSDFVARIGGDEFSIILTDVIDAVAMRNVAGRVRDSMAMPFILNGRPCQMSCAIGMVFHKSGMPNYETLSHAADIALNTARAEGPGALCAFTAEMQVEVSNRDQLARDLRRGVLNGELLPYFQPQVNIQTGEVVGFEALIRWQHPKDGLLSPAAFLSLAHEIDLDETIGTIVLEASLDALQAWQSGGYPVPRVAINISSCQLRDPALVEKLEWELDRRNLPTSSLALEIVETVMVENDDDDIVQTIRRLVEAGFPLELDDFGTGHASISNIRRFGVERIKIDRSFVSNIDSLAALAKMTEAMLRMADALEVSSLAEGVETQAEQNMLESLGCVHIQGYHIGRPMPYEESLKWLNKWQRSVRKPAKIA